MTNALNRVAKPLPRTSPMQRLPDRMRGRLTAAGRGYALGEQDGRGRRWCDRSEEQRDAAEAYRYGWGDAAGRDWH